MAKHIIDTYAIRLLVLEGGIVTAHKYDNDYLYLGDWKTTYTVPNLKASGLFNTELLIEVIRSEYFNSREDFDTQYQRIYCSHNKKCLQCHEIDSISFVECVEREFDFKLSSTSPNIDDELIKIFNNTKEDIKFNISQIIVKNFNMFYDDDECHKIATAELEDYYIIFYYNY